LSFRGTRLDHVVVTGGKDDGHELSAGSDRRALWLSFVLISGFMAFEVVAAWVSHSLVLLADAGHMLTDAGAIAAAIWASRLAERPETSAWTFGLKRAEILAAAGNGITLLVAAALVAFEAVRRLAHPPAVRGLALVVVAAVGVGVNLASTLLLARANRRSLNVQGAFRHILTDLYAFVGTVVAGILILATGYRRADPIASLVVVVLMLHAAWLLLRASGRVLLEGTPEQVDLDEVRTHLVELPEVVGVHDLHAWTVTSQLPIISAHVVVRDGCLTDGTAPRVLDHLNECLTGHFDVEHSTFQLERPPRTRGRRTTSPGEQGCLAIRWTTARELRRSPRHPWRFVDGDADGSIRLYGKPTAR
jgi:cobalt-zinc-cadmium efflux system protein